MLCHVETLYLALLVHAQRNQELDYLERTKLTAPDHTMTATTA